MPEIEVRPGWAGRGSFTRLFVEIGVATLLFVVVAPVGLAVAGLDNAWIIDIPVMVAVGVTGISGFLHLRNQRAGIIHGELYRVSAFGRRRSWPISVFREVVRVQVTVGEEWATTVPLVSPAVIDADLLINKDGVVVMSFTGLWPRNGLSELWRAMGLRLRQPWHGPVRIREVRREYAGALPLLPTSW